MYGLGDRFGDHDGVGRSAFDSCRRVGGGVNITHAYNFNKLKQK